MEKDNSLFKYNGKTYKLVKKPDSFGCTEICPLALANEGNCEELCSEALLDIEAPEFSYTNCMFVEVTENKETTMEEKEHKNESDYKTLYEQECKKYGDAVERMKSWMNGEHPECFSEAQKAAEFVFPELGESEDERIGKDIIAYMRYERKSTEEEIENRFIPWLEKQGEHNKPNPYSGTSFEYNGHVWGMCARDNGVDVLIDKHLIAHINHDGAIVKDRVVPPVSQWLPR